MSNSRRNAGPTAVRALACRANPPSAAPRLALAVALLTGTAACTSSPQYPIYAGERPGDGSIMAAQPAYPISAHDAAQNAADRASQNGYPAYGAPPVAGPQAPAYSPAPPSAAPAEDDASGDAPHGLQSAPVDSSDLAPPPPAAPPSDPPPPPPPQAETLAYGGGRLVFGRESVSRPRLVFAVEDGAPPPLDLVAYRHRRRHAEAASDAAAKSEDRPADAAATSADTPYQTVVKPGEKLSDVAARVHSSSVALAALNDLKHPKHVKPGTVLKVPYRYTYEVQKGDTLYTISHRFSQDPAAMAKLNGLKAVPTLQPGETIQLPPTAEDTGKRDHASAAGPSPVAAPEKLADAALRKETRHGRHRHADAAVAESASTGAAPTQSPPTAAPASEPPPAKLSRAERRRLLREQKAASLAAASQTAPPATTAEPPPARLSRAERRRQRREAKTAARLADSAAGAAPRPVSSPAPQPVVAQATPTSSASPTPYAPTVQTLAVPPAYASAPSASVAPRTYPPTVASSTPAATAPQPYYAGTRPYAAPTPTLPAATARYATGSGATASTYAMPGYTARTPTVSSAAAGSSRVASLTTPSYSPAYPAGGYAPSLGRARPATPTAPSVAGLTATELTAAGRGRFIWPLRGQVLSAFGAKGAGEYNNGMDIAAESGAGVHAAAAGDVVYAGSSIPGYGNMVLIKHPNGWVTAYAHLNRLEVRIHDTVAQGDEIGLAGETGAVNRPELYFEVRYASDATEKPRPVDPTLVLPAG